MAQYHLDKVAFNTNNTRQFEGYMSTMNGPVGHIPLAAGQIHGYSHVEKFGSNLNVGADIETIWNNGGKYTYLTSAAVVYCDTIAADDGEDNAAGTGARTVIIQGLDASYHHVEEEVTVGGAPSTTEFLRVNRAFVQTAGSVGTNTKPVLISTAANGTGTILANISTHGTGSNEEGFGQTFLGLYTIPAGKTGYLTQWTMGSSGTSSVQGFLRYRPVTNGNIFLTRDTIFFRDGLQTKNYIVPLRLEEKSDIEIQGYNDATGIAVSTTFNIILVDNPT
jgi:hypothetical protein